MFGELPFLWTRRGLGQQFFAQDIKPEQLFTNGVPQRAFTQCAAAVVKDHWIAKS